MFYCSQAFGSLYDVLRDETLHSQLVESQMQILQDVCRGVRFLHAANPQVIHGDLKAKNVLIDANFHAKVSDFGLSDKKRVGASGTPFWMAPELLESRTSNTAASDMFAFGILMFELFARLNPYENEGEDADRIIDQICNRSINMRPILPSTCSTKMQDLYRDCTDWDPAKRPTAEAADLLLRVEFSVKERVFTLEKLNRELAEANAKIASASAMQLQHFACMSQYVSYRFPNAICLCYNSIFTHNLACDYQRNPDSTQFCRRHL
jgi:serine/threonine protein kinase